MSERRVQDYVETEKETNEGHVDTRNKGECPVGIFVRYA